MDKDRPVKIVLHLEQGINVTFRCVKYVQDEYGCHYFGVIPEKADVS